MKKTKNKTHQELVKEIWDEADRSFIKVFDEPLDESLRDMYPDAFPTPTVNGKTKTKNKTHQELIKEIWDRADKSDMAILDEPIDPNLDDPFDNFLPPKKDEKNK